MPRRPFSAQASALLVAVVWSLTTAAHAQPLTFTSDRGQVDGIELKYNADVLLTASDILSSQRICGVVYTPKGRELLNQLALGLVGTASGKLPEGFSFVRQRFDLSPGCNARVAYTGNQLSVTITMPRNIVFANITHPTVFGQYSDPSISVDFDVVATAKIDIPSTPSAGLTLGPFEVRVSKIDPQGQNLTGDIGIAVGKLVDDLGGFGFAEQLATGFRFPADDIQISLDRFANAMGERGRTARLSNDYDAKRKIVVLNLGDPNASTPSSGASIAPRMAMSGSWDTVTSSNGRFRMILFANPTGPDPVNGALQVNGTFTNTQGANQYDGSLQGVMDFGSRTLRYTYAQNNGTGGTGIFTLSTDGNALTGEGIHMDKDRFTWNGTRIEAPKPRCPAGMRGPNCEEMIVN